MVAQSRLHGAYCEDTARVVREDRENQSWLHCICGCPPCLGPTQPLALPCPLCCTPLNTARLAAVTFA